MPNDLFDQDRLIWRILSRVTDVLLLGFMWTVTSLPIITIGASSTAVYYVTLKMARNQEGYLWKGYWKSFKENFKQATILWVILLALAVFFGLDIYYYYLQESTLASGVQAFFIGMLVLLIIVVIYIFPIISRFSNSTGRLFSMSIFMPFKHFGWTLALLGMFLLSVFLGWFIKPYFMFAYGVYAYLSSNIFVKIFKPYEVAIQKKNGTYVEEEETDEEGME